MKLSSFVLPALLAVQASCAVLPRDDDYTNLEELLRQAQDVAKAELAAAEVNGTSKRTTGPAACTLKNVRIRKEW